MAPTTIDFDEPKLKELILYVIERGADDPAMGATKLNKVLYFSDFLAYGHLGTPITGAEYQRLGQGPAPRRLLPVRDQLIEAGDAVLVPISTPRGRQDRLFARRAADLSVFTAAEIALVDRVMEWLRYLNADEVSELSHREIGWQIHGQGETIPYATALLSSDPLPSEAIAWAQGKFEARVA